MIVSPAGHKQSADSIPAFETTYSPERRVIIVRFNEFSKRALHDYCQAIVQQSREHNCKNILLDASGRKLCLSAVEIYQLPSILSEYGIDHNFWHAILADQNQPEYKFFETVAFNRSYRVRVFHDQKSALDWLGYGKRGFIL